MSRNEEYQFIPTDAAEVERYLTELYEGLCKIKVRQATPEWLYIKWVTEIIIQERVLNNYTGNQNCRRLRFRNIKAHRTARGFCPRPFLL